MRYFIVNYEREVTLDELNKLANFRKEDVETVEWNNVELISANEEEMRFSVKKNIHWK